MWRYVYGAMVALVLTAAARADFARDLARIHTEAIGGKDRVQAVKTLRAAGVTTIEGKRLSFVLWAARPNSIRTEVTAEGRISTEGYNGTDDRPWARSSASGKIARMSAQAAAEFCAEAEFDDPLVLPSRAQVSLDYAGEEKIGGRSALRVLVTRNFSQTSVLFLDAVTYFIVRREQVGPDGKRVVTDYGDFRSVRGVIYPHRLTVSVDGKHRYETIIATIEPNVKIADGWFDAPVTAGK